MRVFISFLISFIFSSGLYAKDLYLDCLDLYGGNSTVKISDKYFGLGNKEIFIKPKGTWEKVKILHQDDASVFFNDGWGFENSKKCKSSKYTNPTFCVINKEIDLLVRKGSVGPYLRVNEYFNNHCCHSGKEYNPGDWHQESVCLILKTP